MDTILVVDDEPEVVEVLASVLRYHDYAVMTASDGLEALALATTQRVDLVISDFQMPRLDGIQLSGQLASEPKTQHIPVILMSSAQLGVDHHSVKAVLGKPFDMETLISHVRGVLPQRMEMY